MEIWKDIIGYEGKYQISNEGKIKSINYRRSGIEGILKIKKHYSGHGRVVLCDGTITKCIVSRLVAIAFIPNPNNLPLVCHKDETLDENGMLYNGMDNLFWGTYADNAQDRDRKGRSNNHFKNNHPRWMLGKQGKDHQSSKPILQYTKDKRLVKNHESIMNASRETGIVFQSISKCCKGMLNTAGGFIWKFK